MTPPRRRLGHNAPADDDNPHTNLPPSFPARFMSVLDLYRAQRDTPSQVQAAPPSPTFRVQYQPDAPPVYHTLFAVLSSQATVVDQEELDAIRAAVPSPPDTPSPEAVMEAVQCVLPSLNQDAIANSVIAMERVLAQSSAPNELELNDVPPEVWATLRVAVPLKGSSIHDSISRASSFAEARDSIHSANSSPMDDLPTNPLPPPLFLPGSSGSEQPSRSYHPASLEATSQQTHVIGDHLHPIYVHSSSPKDEQLAITQRLEHAPASLSMEPERLTPEFQQHEASNEASSNLRAMAGLLTQTPLAVSISSQLHEDAVQTLTAITNELNQVMEGHSHYFLRDPLTLIGDPGLEIKTEELRKVLDIAAAVISGGPNKDPLDVWPTLRPSDWFRASTHLLAAVARGALRVKHVGRAGNYPLEPMRDNYLRSDTLPQLETQRNLLEALANQIAEQLTLDNGPYLPHDSIDGIRATVWHAHEAQIRAAVVRKANKVEDRITTMGLSELIDNLLNKASTAEITDTIREDIELQIRSKHNNARLVAENDAYKSMIKQATAEGRSRAAAEALQVYATTSANLKEMKERQVKADAEVYYKNLLETAKNQARLQADSDFSRLLADECSAIAPRVEAEIKAEHTKTIQERRLATMAMLQALTLEEEKECIRAEAARLGMDIQSKEPATKKVKVDQRKARPAPIMPRARSKSMVSATSTNSHKRALETVSRDEQKTPTPASVQEPNVTTVEFTIKQEQSPFPTPSTPSVIQDAVNLATDLPISQTPVLTPPTPSVIRNAVNLASNVPPTQESIPPLHGLSSSIHNEANQMAIERDSFDPASIFPPGIPAPPSNVSLPPAMSRTPPFGGAEALEDGIATSCSPEVQLRSAVQISVDATIGPCLQPLWETIHRLEALLTNNIPRAPPRAGPGYRTEHINKQTPKVSSAAIAPRLTNQGTRTHDNIEGVTPFPSVSPIAQPERTPTARVDDDEEFPQLNHSRGQRRRQNAQARALEARRSVPGAVGDDGYIPTTSNNSRIKPLFANIITQSVVAQQQQVQRSAAQALLRSDYAASVYHMSWDYHVVMMSLVLDYSTTFHTTSHNDSYYYRD
jgi:hypothetical protein